MFYPIRTPETLPECEYEGHFFRGGQKNRVLTSNTGSRSRSGASTAKLCEECDAGGGDRSGKIHNARIFLLT